VSTYIGLGNRSVTAAEDPTGLNPGNWTNAFTADVLGITVPQFEIYRGVVTSSPALGVAAIQVGVRQVSFTAPGFGGGSEWDPSQPPILLPGQDLYFFWTAAASGTPPVVTLWLRYDLDVVLAARKGLVTT
jgi:hypothetical protein